MFRKFAPAPKSGAEDEEPFLPGNQTATTRSSRRWVYTVLIQWIIVAALCIVITYDHMKLSQRLPRNGDEVYCKF
jgi:hypothetical protein